MKFLVLRDHAITARSKEKCPVAGNRFATTGGKIHAETNIAVKM